MPFQTISPSGGRETLAPLAGAHDPHGRRVQPRGESRAGLAEREEPRLRRSDPEADVAAGRILIVDDEAAIRLICRINFLYAGYELLEAASGDEAIAVARRERPDLVLLDVMMPTLDGWQVAERLAADPETAKLPIAFLSARTDTDDRRRGYELGALGFFTKPFDPATLVAEIGALVARLERGERDAVRAEYRARFSRPVEA